MSLFNRRRPEPAFYPGEDIQKPGALRLEGVKKRAIDIGRNRLIVTAGLFLLAFVVVGLRLVDLTVLSGAGEGASRPRAQRATDAVVRRADIADRNAVLLATSLPTVSLYAKPNEIIDADEAAAKLAKVMRDSNQTELRTRLSGERSFIYLRRHLTPRQQQEINDLGIPGLYFEDSERRVYPQGSLVSHVVGLTDWDNKGIAGIEKTFDGQLSGEHQPVRLSIDLRVQDILRNELTVAIAQFRAIGGVGMVFDVNTGEIIAMVSLPDFDPNAPATTTSEAMFNRATLGVYEMGSTFKLFNTAIALDSGKASMTSMYDASAPIHISRFTITDYHTMHRALSVPEILIHSSKIGSARMAVDFGGEMQKQYMGRFGMLRPTPVELPEVGSPLTPSPWREINTMTIAYGHGIAVTPLQVVTGMAALINGGSYIRPTLIKRQAGAELPSAQVLKPQTSENMRRLMRMVVTQGTGSKAEVAGYEIGGKTGTAEKLGTSGGYRKKSLLSSFVGAFPMSSPRYAVVAWIDEPQGTRETYGYATGGWTAAPVVGRVVAQIAPMLGIRPAPADGRIQDAVMVKEDVDIGETE